MTFRRFLFRLVALLPTFGFLQGQDVLETMVVSAGRAPQEMADVPFAVDVIVAQRLRESPAATVDETLREAAAFSLFRRTSSLIANPTAQGVSLRGIGPSGASRSLVLLDGVPLNDPFGGWVAWSKVLKLNLNRAEIVRGGGSGVWGNAALGGTVALFTAPLEANTGEVELQAGDFETLSTEGTVTVPAGKGFLRAGVRFFQTDGFQVVNEAQRGPVDQALDSEHRLLQVDWSQPMAESMNLRLSGRLFEEKRGNGTPLQRNDSEEALFSAAVNGITSAEQVWKASAYLQRQSFSSFFSAVNADRTAETPANNQFDVPSTATGATMETTLFWSADALTTLGGDFRWVEGETREEYLFQEGEFRRERRAGGEQLFAGAFVQHDQALGAAWQLTGTLRGDYWENKDGHRRETDRAMGDALRDDVYADQTGWELSPRVGLTWQAAKNWHFRSAVYRAFRLPTLNEYYRPFRVGNVTTEANSDLRVEALDGVEAGTDLTFGDARLGLTGFVNELRDAVSNVTVAPNNRQRQNLDLVRVQGLELDLEWSPIAELTWRASGLLTHSEASPSGLRPAQTPNYVLSAGLDWQAPWGLLASARVRWLGQQYEDDENLLSLQEAATLNLQVSRSWQQVEVFAALENALDAEVQTSQTAAGLTTYDAPRQLRGGLRLRW